MSIALRSNVLAALAASSLLAGCGGGGGNGGGSSSPPTISFVSVSCVPTSVQTGQTSQCSTTVTGTGSYSSAVIWSADSGTISGSGLYTAPATVPASGSATIKASSNQDPTKAATATLTIAAPAPTITSVVASCTPTSIQTSQSSQCSATVTGTGSYSSAVTWSADSGTVTAAGLYTAPSTVPASGVAAVKATSTQDSTKSGTTMITVTSPPASNGSLVILGTPVDGGPGNGPWAIVVAASDASGNPASGQTVALTSTEGTLSSIQGTTNSNGSLTLSITPPVSYAGEAVAVSATLGGQVAAINIVFVPSVFNPANQRLQNRYQSARQSAADTPQASTTPQAQPFVYGASGTAGLANPFTTANTCYSNVALTSTIPADCQSTYNNQGIVSKLPNLANAFCTADSVISGALDCAGTVLSIGTCLTGVGALVCAGGLLETAPGCAIYVASILPRHYTLNPILQTGIDVVEAGLEPGPLGLNDAIGLFCDDLGILNSGTGTSGTQVTVSPQGPLLTLGGSVQFSSSDASVNWSIDGVLQASGIYGTITANGLYTAPLSLPNPAFVSITATDKADPTATAGTDVHVVAAPPGTISTVVGDGVAGYSGDGGAAVAAQLSDPTGIAFDGGGNMFIADSSNNVIRRVDASTKVITTIAGTGTAGYSGDGAAGTNAELNQPAHVVFDRTVNLYITDANNERIRKVDAITDEITTVAGDGTAGFSGDSGPAKNAEFNYPDGVALDTNGNLYIGDARNNRIREVTVANGNIATVAGNGVAGYSGDGSNAANAELDFPSRPYVDPKGNIFIADYQNNRVRKVDGTSGIITTIAGNGVAGLTGDGGPATDAELNGPLSVALDPSGILFIADINNERIRAINTTTNPITVLGITVQPGQIVTVAGNGQAGYHGDGGPAVNAEINFPTGLTVDSAGNLYFADAHNNVVRKIVGQ